MRRREFIMLLSCAAAIWPLAARAQQPERVRRVGVLVGLAENDPHMKERIAGLRQGLEKLGWVEGSNLRRSEEHTSELQSLRHLVCRLLLEKKNRTHGMLH